MTAQESVMIVEDDCFIAMDFAEELKRAGFDIAAICSNVEEASRALQSTTPDYAILDYNLKSETSFPIGERLCEQSVPFVFVTGNPTAVPVEKLPFKVKVLEKPIDVMRVVDALAT